MHPGERRWDEDKLKVLFIPQMVSEITAIPLDITNGEDKLIWGDECNGIYTVRSGYNFMMSKMLGGHRCEVVGDWSSLWKARVPPKIRNFIWRVCRGCLPTRQRLQERNVSCPLNCELCLNPVENELHIFFHCSTSMHCWTIAGLDDLIRNRLHRCVTVAEVIMDICSSENPEVVQHFMMLLWGLWNNRNNMIWNQNHLSAHDICLNVNRFWQEWYAIQELHNSGSHHANIESNMRWQTPEYGTLKCVGTKCV